MTPPRPPSDAVEPGPDRRAVPRRRPRPPRFAFPCGHVEGRGSVNRRLRATERAVWVRCRSCNVVALVVARSAGCD